MEYTRAQIREKVRQILRDQGKGKFSDAVINHTIERICADFVCRTHCFRNWAYFTISSASSDGELIYDAQGIKPTLSRIEVGNTNFYKLSGCYRISKVCHWRATDDDTRRVPVELLSILEGETDYLSAAHGYPRYVISANSPDVFCFLPAPAESDYPVQIVIAYYAQAISMITNASHPTDDDTPDFSGSGLNDMTVSQSPSTYGTWEIKVSGVGSHDSFRWRKDSGEWSGDVIMEDTNAISDGLVVAWGHVTGHTVGDVWTLYYDDARPPCIPQEYRYYLVPGVASELLLIEDDGRAQLYRAMYEGGVELARRDANRTGGRRLPFIPETYQGEGL